MDEAPLQEQTFPNQGTTPHDPKDESYDQEQTAPANMTQLIREMSSNLQHQAEDKEIGSQSESQLCHDDLEIIAKLLIEQEELEKPTTYEEGKLDGDLRKRKSKSQYKKSPQQDKENTSSQQSSGSSDSENEILQREKETGQQYGSDQNQSDSSSENDYGASRVDLQRLDRMFDMGQINAPTKLSYTYQGGPYRKDKKIQENENQGLTPKNVQFPGQVRPFVRAKRTFTQADCHSNPRPSSNGEFVSNYNYPKSKRQYGQRSRPKEWDSDSD